MEPTALDTPRAGVTSYRLKPCAYFDKYFWPTSLQPTSAFRSSAKQIQIKQLVKSRAQVEAEVQFEYSWFKQACFYV
nr:unnamed protein product [Callosobruchus analis]